MKTRKTISCTMAAVLMTLLTSVGLTTQPAVTYAEEVPSYRIGIAPSQQALGTITPGERYSGKFMVKNTGRESIEYTVSVAPYAVETENYNPNYSTHNRYTEISDWITTDKSEGTLAADEQEEISYTVTVPSDAHGGSQSATIMVTMENPSNSEGNAVQTVRQVGYIVYGNVDGEITETGKILENKIPSFIFTPPITATSLVENTGNVYTNATYSIQVFPLFSDEEVYTNEEDPDKSVIFPETKRFYTASWDGAPQLGIFRVRQIVKIFDEVSTVEKLVFLCPIWFLFIVALIIFVAIFWIVSRIRGRKNA